jgi:hypothetical protein
MPRAARVDVDDLLNRLPPRALRELGLVSAAWVYLETEMDLAIQCLLVHPKAEGVHTDALILPFNRRLTLCRQLGKKVYGADLFKQFDRVLGKVANAHGKRDPFMHGRLIPYTNRRFVIQNHRHTDSCGVFRVKENWTNADKIRAASEQISDAAAHLIAFNRKHLPGSPASWLDMPRPHTRSLPRATPTTPALQGPRGHRSGPGLKREFRY